ncbi:unnamed protein product, partial [marine sediment metagenome]
FANENLEGYKPPSGIENDQNSQHPIPQYL